MKHAIKELTSRLKIHLARELLIARCVQQGQTKVPLQGSGLVRVWTTITALTGLANVISVPTKGSTAPGNINIFVRATGGRGTGAHKKTESRRKTTIRI